MTAPLLAAHDVRVALGGEPVLRGVSLEVRAGEVVGLLGPNGAGKSTFLRAATALLPLASGRIEVAGQPLADLDRRTLARLVAVVQQLPAMQRYDWVVDNLNTHWSLAVCRLVAQWCKVPCVAKDLRRGVQRRAFLSDPTHKHVFHFTPKHGSWLNQVELWFSVLARRFLKRGNFCSAQDFETRLCDYLEVYNTHAAHPYRWTYAGQPLVRATPFSQMRRQQRHGRAWFSSRPQRFERTLYPPRPYKRAAAELAANL